MKIWNKVKEYGRKAYDFAKSHVNALVGVGGGAVVMHELSKTACAEEVVLPTNPLDVGALATAAFNTFGETIGTVFPYVLVLGAMYLGMRLIKRLAGGKA